MLQPLAEQAVAAFDAGTRGRGDPAGARRAGAGARPAAGAEAALPDPPRRQRPAAAEALIRRVVALYPNDFWATNELTLLLLGKGALAEAEVHARNAVRIAPQNAQAHHLMGMIMTEINRPQIGEYHYRRALELADQPRRRCCSPTSPGT